MRLDRSKLAVTAKKHAGAVVVCLKSGKLEAAVMQEIREVRSFCKGLRRSMRNCRRFARG